MQGHRGMVDEALEKLMEQVDIELADAGAGEIDVIFQTGPAGEIYHHAGQRFIERHVGLAVTAQTLFVAERPGKGLTQGDADVLDAVMVVDMPVAAGNDLQIDETMTGYLVEHVVEKPDAGVELGDARTVKVKTNDDPGFEGVACDFGFPHGVGRMKMGNREGEASVAAMIPFSRRLSSHPPYVMSRYWSAVVHGLTPYVPGEQPKLPNLIKLNTNENPYGPSPRVLEALRREMGDSLRLYPDPNAERLKAAIAAHYGITSAQVFVGNGSDEVLAHAFPSLLKHDRPLCFPDITYSFYPVYCGLYGIDYETVPLDGDFRIRVEDYARPNGGIIFPNPNAPTGCFLPLAHIERLLAGNADSVVVIDEAYVDFGGASAISLVGRHPNLLVVQTLSKSRSLAGLRVGFAVGHPDLIEALTRVKDSFNSYPLDRLALAGATAAMDDREYFDHTRTAVMRSRDALSTALAGLGFRVLPSAANFIFVTHPGQDAGVLAQALRKRGIIIRHFRAPRIEQYLRITVGTDAQCAALIEALRDILAA